MNPFPCPLHFDNAGTHNGRRCIIITRRFPAITSLGMVETQPGFISDGGSIPNCAAGLVGTGFDDALECYVIHDWLYSSHNKDYSRAESDFILKELLWNQLVPKIRTWRDLPKVPKATKEISRVNAIYTAVRIFGGANFKGNPP